MNRLFRLEHHCTLFTADVYGFWTAGLSDADWFISFRKCRSLRRPDRSHQVSSPLNMKHSLCWDSSRTNPCPEDIGTASRWIKWLRGLSRRGGLRWADGRRTFWNTWKVSFGFALLDWRTVLDSWMVCPREAGLLYQRNAYICVVIKELPRLASFLMRNNWEKRKEEKKNVLL